MKLVVYNDTNLNFQYHFKYNAKMYNDFICDVRCVCRHLNLDAFTVLVNALVSSRLNIVTYYYTNYKIHLNKPCVQNSSARVITVSTRYTSNKPLLDMYHWIPIASRIDLYLY